MKYGDSLAVVGDEGVIKVHVHTNDPGLAIQEALSYGQLLTIKVENMKLQHENKVLKELQYNQTEEIILLQKNHATNMKKLDKLQEYNKISDMTNQLFEKRLSGLENAIKQLNNSIGA